MNDQKITGIYRVKIESRFIEQSLKSVMDICTEIIILDDNYSGFQTCAADLNFDDFINVMDITAVISIIIGEQIEN